MVLCSKGMMMGFESPIVLGAHTLDTTGEAK